MTRGEHLEWCKERAREFARRGDLTKTVTSMISDLGKHPETESSVQMATLLAIGLTYGLKTPADLLDWVEGFN